MSPTIRPEIIIPGTNRVRDATSAEAQLVHAFIERYVAEHEGRPPQAVHPVEGVGDVFFRRLPEPELQR